MTPIEQLEANLRSRLIQHNEKQQKIIISWLLGENKEELANCTPQELKIREQGFNFRAQLLEKHYLQVNPNQAYNKLINRLASLIQIRQKIRIWLAQSRDRQRAVADVIQEVIQEMLKNDRYIQEQINWIGKCTQDRRLRNTLMLVSIEEYCLRPIRNQPLLAYRFVNFLRRQERAGMTQVPRNDIINLISEEIESDDTDSSISLFDSIAIAKHEDKEEWQEKQSLRLQVQQELESYLAEKLGQESVRWLKLYLQGRSQDEISKIMNVPVKQIYRLREKINYHALKGFALKIKPELVTNWLEIEDNFGLTPGQWESYWENLTPSQKQIVNYLQEGQTIEIIAKSLKLTKTQIMADWTTIYLTAQSYRNNLKL